MNAKNKQFALIGCGYWGKNILRNLVDMEVLKTVCDTSSDLLGEYKQKFPNLEYTQDIEKVWTDPQIKAVFIATPAITHFELVKKAILAGKDVFVEKPLALTVKEGQELLELAQKTKRILMVGHILQYHPAVIKLKEMISNGDLGKIRYIYSNRLNIGKLRTEENILWSFAPHDISVILMLLGEEPDRVVAFGGDYLNPGVNDVTLTMLEFKDGVKGHVFVSWLHPFKEQKLIVVGSKAMAVFDDVSKEKLFLYPHKIEWKNGKVPVAEKAEFQVIPFEQGEPLRLELQHFLDCVQTRREPKTNAVEGLKVLKVLEAAELNFNKNNSSGSRNSMNSGKEFFAHETSIIDEGTDIGKGTQIWHFSHVLKGSCIGKDCRIGQNVVIGPHSRVGNNCKIQNNVSLYEGVELEDAVFCGPSCVFTNVFNPRCEIPRMKELKVTLAKKGTTIGANATIVCGHTLGSYSFVGAGAVVTKDVPDYALVYGNPAKIEGWICECGIKLDFKKNKAVCLVCGKEYFKKENKISRKK
jgi:UDP-2-acetamido-3-amino-2,3-dideoxy-glucuronate N-acetyltransferase